MIQDRKYKMKRLKIFISSVQSEFAEERQMLFQYLTTDALLGKFCEPFIFEQLPATNIKPDEAYLKQVEQCDVYIGIFGKDYGYEDSDGISPTEREFNHAEINFKTRLIFITNHNDNQRHPKEIKLIQKAEKRIVRKKFNSSLELKTAIYAALIGVLEEKEFIRYTPFDATACKDATINHINPERVQWFVEMAKAKRGFPHTLEGNVEKILTHLNLFKNNRLTNAAILLFGKNPQQFFITSEVRCAMFYGNEIVKPIPAYQVYKGDVFQLIDQTIDFIISRINFFVSDRSKSVNVTTTYELPYTAVAEAVVNAVAHRDYTGNGSIQVMLFRNRLEIWNPGQLPYILPVAKLKEPHPSYPTNPLIAESLYLTGYIERMGTGIPDMIKACLAMGLTEPQFVQEEDFRIIISRASVKDKPEDEQATPQATLQPTPQVKQLILIIEDEMTREELQQVLQLRDRENFRKLYISEALNLGYLEMTIPQVPNSPNQKYRLTEKGENIKEKWKAKR